MSGDIEYTVLLERRGYKPIYRGTNWNVAVGMADAYIRRGDMVRIEERATTVTEFMATPFILQKRRAGKCS